MSDRVIKAAAVAEVVAILAARRVGDDLPPAATDEDLSTQDLLDAALAVATVLDRFSSGPPLLEMVGEAAACRAAGVDPRPGLE